MRIARYVLPLLALAACSDAAARDDTPTIATQPFDSVFRLARTVTPEQPDSAPIGVVSGIEFAPDGGLILGDAPGTNVKRYDAEGRLVRIYGRGGFGPGEFQLPVFPRLDARGRLHVPDLLHNRVAVFDSAGEHLRTVSLLAHKPVYQVEVLPDGDYLVASTAYGQRDLLLRTDSLGALEQSWLPITRITPAGERMVPTWQNVRYASFDVVDGTAYVTTSISDSLWTVDVASGSVRATPVRPADYIKPTVPRGDMMNLERFSEWGRSWTSTALVRAGGRDAAVVFSTGILMEGAPSTVVIGGPGRWTAASGAPPLLEMRGDTLVGLLSATADTVRIGYFVRR